MKKITTAWAPNVQKDDLLLAISLLFRPWRWFGNDALKKLESIVSDFVCQKVLAFDSGRSALYAILRAYGIKEGDEILLQAFTCVALPNPILWVGATPIWVDIDLENYNIDLDDLEKKITPNSKAIIIQYTFGICPNIEKILEICKKHKLLLIEDCCHNFGQKIRLIVGNESKEFFAGTVGDVAIYSFGMEKVISATRGGFATAKNSDILANILEQQQSLHKPRTREILRGIFNPLIWKAREKLGYFGKLIYQLAIKLKIHELGLTKLELVGKKASWLPYSMPNTNAILGLNQFKKLNIFNEHRKSIADKYYQALKNCKKESLKLVDKKSANEFADAIWLRFPIIIENADKVRSEAEKKGIHLGNWYTEVIHCKDVDMDSMHYSKGSCPKAEWLVQRAVNLPTHQGIGEGEVTWIVKLLK